MKSKKDLPLVSPKEKNSWHKSLQVRWQKQNGKTVFSTIFSPKTKFNNHSQISIPMWKSGSSVKKFQQTVGGKKDRRLDTSKRVRGRVLLYSHHISPKAEQLSAKKPPQLIIPSTKKSECLNEFLTSLAVQNSARVSPHSEYWGELYNWWSRGWENTASALMNPTNHFADLSGCSSINHWSHF